MPKSEIQNSAWLLVLWGWVAHASWRNWFTYIVKNLLNRNSFLARSPCSRDLRSLLQSADEEIGISKCWTNCFRFSRCNFHEMFTLFISWCFLFSSDRWSVNFVHIVVKPLLCFFKLEVCKSVRLIHVSTNHNKRENMSCSCSLAIKNSLVNISLR